MTAIYSQFDIDEAYGQSRPQITTYPTVKFCAAESAKGKSEVKHFTLLGKDKDGKLTAEDLGEKIEVCFMTRGSFRLHKASYTSSESKQPQTSPVVNIYKQDKATGKRSLVGSGVWKEMKAKFGLSTQQLPYATVGENIAKIIISPSSLENYWKYLEEFKGEERVYQFMTIIKAEDKITKGEGGEYYKMAFKRGDKLDVESIEMMVEDIMDLRDKLKKNEEAYQIKPSELKNDEFPEPPIEFPEESIIDEEEIIDPRQNEAGL